MFASSMLASVTRMTLLASFGIMLLTSSPSMVVKARGEFLSRDGFGVEVPGKFVTF